MSEINRVQLIGSLLKKNEKRILQMAVHEDYIKKETIPDGWVVPSAKSISIFRGGVGDNKETV